MPANTLLYLWPQRTFYLGELDGAVHLQLAASVLLFALDAPLLARCGSHSLRASSLLLPVGEKVVIEGGGRIALCYLDVFGHDLQHLSPRLQWQRGPVRGALAEQDAALAWLHEQSQAASPVTLDELAAWLEQLINPQQQSATVRGDPRIARVVELIQEDVACNRQIAELAAAVGLNVSRLTQLFRQQVGIPVRRYRQWHRLFVTSCLVAGGANLTDAALQAGFSDSAHFCHTFRSLAGMNPSQILLRPGRLFLQADLRPLAALPDQGKECR